MRHAHAVLLLALAGCSWLTDFDRFGHAAHSTQDAGQDASMHDVDAGDAADAAAVLDASRGQDAGVGHADTGTAPQDAGRAAEPDAEIAEPLPPLGPYTTADLPHESGNRDVMCGNATLFQGKWPRSTLSDAACPDWLVQSGAIVFARPYGTAGNTSPCEWRGVPEGVTFTLNNYPTEPEIYAQWNGPKVPYRMTVVWRGLVCIYKSGSTL